MGILLVDRERLAVVRDGLRSGTPAQATDSIVARAAAGQRCGSGSRQNTAQAVQCCAEPSSDTKEGGVTPLLRVRGYDRIRVSPRQDKTAWKRCVATRDRQCVALRASSMRPASRSATARLTCASGLRSVYPKGAHSGWPQCVLARMHS